MPGRKQLTIRLNNGLTVTAKMYKGTPCAVTYANKTQAYDAAEKIGGTVYGVRPFYVSPPESAVQE